MVLLELTLKQAELVKEALLLKKDAIAKENVGPTERERKHLDCALVMAKTDSAMEPQQEVSITGKDFFDLMSMTKEAYQQLNADLYLSNKKVEENHFLHISLYNAFIMWLNRKNLLKKRINFDFTDHSSQFEETE